MNPRRVGLPPRPFLYSIDQIAWIVNVKIETVMDRYIFYAGRSIGTRPPGMMTARDISPRPDDIPVWRVGETELIRWMQHKGFKFYERASLYSESPDYNATWDKERQHLAPDSLGDDGGDVAPRAVEG
jgi:hypothetical protein